MTSAATPLPLPSLPINVRAATMEDLAFIDALQKKHAKAVGWMPTQQLEGKIAAGHVMIADATVESGEWRVESKEDSSLSTPRSPLSTPLGYLIGNDRYFKRDDVGIIYQMNVVPGRQRGLIGATLLKAQFERSAYGCRLYCCWCAQDLAANKFWEAMGFKALAFRAGSRTKGKGADGKCGPRVHIFWQKRIRAGDTSTPWWFPSQTSSGSIREDRLVLPIPPGTHWSDAKPMVLPEEQPGDQSADDAGAGSLAVANEKKKRSSSRLAKSAARLAADQPLPTFGATALRFVGLARPKRRHPQRDRVKMKNDPRMVAAARELRDRWLEQMNAEPFEAISGKYDVSRKMADSERAAALFARDELIRGEIEQSEIIQRERLALPEIGTTLAA